MTYDTFISYSHAADGRLAAAVQRSLQQLARPWWRRRALRVFRDTTGLSVSPHLWGSIATALDDAEWFVLLASPEAAQSEWVNREIEHWLVAKPIEQILPVVTGGDWDWDPALATFRESSSAVPESLRGRYTDEPRHLDLRWARSEADLNLRTARFRDAMAELAAPMHHVAKDDLEGEDLKQHRRTIRLARGATTVLALLLVVAIASGVVALQQRSTARRQAATPRRAANTASAQKLAAQAINAVHDGRNDLGLLLAVEANRLDPSTATRAGLLSSLVDQPMLARDLHGLDDVSSVVFSPDGRKIAATSSAGQVMVWDVSTGRPLPHQPAHPAAGRLLNVTFADNARLLVGVSIGADGSPPQTVSVWDVGSGRLLRTIPVPISSMWAAAASGAPFIVVANGNTGTASVVDLRTGTARGRFQQAGETAGAYWALSPDGALVTVATYGTGAQPGLPANVAVQTWRVADGQPVGPGCHSDFPIDTTGNGFYATSNEISVAADGRGVRVVQQSGNGNRVVFACDLASGQVTTATVGLPGGRLVSGESPDARTLVSRDPDGTVRLFDAATHAAIGVPLHAPIIPSGMSTVDGTVVFSPDSRLATATDDDGTVRVWNVRSTQPAIASSRPLTAFAGAYAGLTMDHDGGIAVAQTVANNSGSSRLDVVDVGRGSVLGRIADTPGGSISDDGRFVVATNATQLVVFDTRHRTTRTLPLTKLKCANAVAVTSRPPTVAVACRNLADVTNPLGFVQRVDISGPHWRVDPPTDAAVWPDALAFSPNGQVLAAQTQTAGSSALQLFAVAPRGLRPGLNVPNARSFVFTADSKSVITNRGRLTSWPTTGAPHPTDLSGATEDGFLSVAPDGRLLASDTTGGIALWDLPSDTELGVLPGATGNYPVTFSTNSRTMSTLTQSPAQLGAAVAFAETRWDLDPAAWERAACVIANRNLTRAEWAADLGPAPYRPTCPDAP